MESSQQEPQVTVIGSGCWGKNLVRNFHRLRRLRLVSDTTEAACSLARQQAPEIRSINDAAEVFHSDIQGIVIATVAETHYALASQALVVGHDVFVEKPLALTYAQGARLVRLTAEHRRILMVGHVLEYHPAIRAWTELVRSGELGKVHYSDSNRPSLGKVRREENIPWSFAPRIECQAFLQATETRQPPIADLASGLRVLAVLSAAQRLLMLNCDPATLPSMDSQSWREAA